MSSSSKPSGFPNVPAPPGSKAGTAANRFIPREELRGFSNWQPGPLGGSLDGQARAAPSADRAAPAEPSAAEWRAQVAAARQAGYQDGYRDGLAALEGFKHSFALQATSQIGALLQAFDEQLDALDGRIAQALSQTATELARQVLRAELKAHPELVARIASEAVQAVMLSARHISVHVHPDDLALVADGAEAALAARQARLQADPTVARGGVIVHSDIGSIDAAIGSRWAQAAAALGGNAEWETPAT